MSKYSEIISYMEKRYPKTGGYIFEYLSLLPISLFLPPIHYGNKLIRPNLSLLLLGPSGSAKTDISLDFQKIAYNPLVFDYITAVRLEREIRGSEYNTILVNDLARVSKDKDIMKILESVIEEGVSNRLTNNYSLHIQTRAIAFLAGVPQDLSAYISSGLLFRVIPIFISHNKEEQKEIGKIITENLSKESKINDFSEIIDYYKKLYLIQTNKDLKNPPVINFEFTEKQKEDVYNSWASLIDKLNVDDTTIWFRELYDCFRMAMSLACLEYFDREKIKKERGVILKVDDVDIAQAIRLNKRELLTKFDILQLEKIRKKMSILKELKRY